MKLIAEIETGDGVPVRLSCDGERLTITIGLAGEGSNIPLDEFRKALDAVAPRQTVRKEEIGRAIDLMAYTAEATARSLPTRAPDGTRIGPSPRESMRARPAPEANVVDAQEDTAA